MTRNEEEDLASRILHHKRKYYDGEAEISDAEYDKLEEKLKNLTSSHSVLHIVGTPVGGKVNQDSSGTKARGGYPLKKRDITGLVILLSQFKSWA